MVRQVLARIFPVYIELVFNSAILRAPLTEHLAGVSWHPVREGVPSRIRRRPGLWEGGLDFPEAPQRKDVSFTRACVQMLLSTCLLLGACFSVSVLNCG